MPRQHALKRAPNGLRRKYARAYRDEQHALSGRRIPGIEHPPFNGRTSFSSGIRCRPAPQEIDPAEQEFRNYKHRYLEDNPVRGERVTGQVQGELG